MKKTKKLLLLCSFIVVLIVGLGINSMAAAPSEISVQVCDKLIELKSEKPVEQNGSIFVPLRDFFESLGANVSYYDATQTVTATRGGTTASFTIGYKGMQIVSASGTKTIALDVAPYYQNDSVMVPVRSAAEAFGCKVGWDNRAKTVLIFDIDGFIKSSGAHFTLMNKVMSITRNDKTYAVNGSCNMSVTGDMIGDKPATISGTLSGLQSKDAVNLDMSMDFSSFLKALDSEGLTDEAELFMKNFSIKAIYNKDGKMYIQSDVLSKQMELTGD
ncbi:MAG TPA: copper amine oxidase N-terminal domain-containing protein, partial [Clostridia bacterium]|nr:copper amine oxidase N-terminal domain-containing protein [Clostridia bacterium]